MLAPATIKVMGKKRQEGDGHPGPEKPARERRISVELEPDLHEALERYCSSHEIKLQTSAVVRAALRAFLKDKGAMKPPPARPEK